jgi:hypothetical protein
MVRNVSDFVNYKQYAFAANVRRSGHLLALCLNVLAGDGVEPSSASRGRRVMEESV